MSHQPSSSPGFRIEAFLLPVQFLLRMAGDEGWMELFWGSSCPVVGDLLSLLSGLPYSQIPTQSHVGWENP